MFLYLFRRKKRYSSPQMIGSNPQGIKLDANDGLPNRLGAFTSPQFGKYDSQSRAWRKRLLLWLFWLLLLGGIGWIAWESRNVFKLF